MIDKQHNISIVPLDFSLPRKSTTSSLIIAYLSILSFLLMEMFLKGHNNWKQEIATLVINERLIAVFPPVESTYKTTCYGVLLP